VKISLYASIGESILHLSTIIHCALFFACYLLIQTPSSRLYDLGQYPPRILSSSTQRKNDIQNTLEAKQEKYNKTLLKQPISSPSNMAHTTTSLPTTTIPRKTSTSTQTPSPQLPQLPPLNTTHPLPPITLHNSPASAQKFNHLTSTIFLHSPLTILLRLEADHPPNNILTPQHIHAGYSLRTTRKLASGASIIESANWAAFAIWDPPGSNLTGPPLSPSERLSRPIFANFIDTITAAKLRYMGPDQKFWHLSMMARDPSVQPPVKGAVRAVIEPYLQRAKEDGLPVWLEAASARTRDVYAYLGFETLEQANIGEGTNRADGYPAVDGEDAPGVPIWFMIYNRKSIKRHEL
jgi:hypothetical protein